jgi:hypothetical protein
MRQVSQVAEVDDDWKRARVSSIASTVASSIGQAERRLTKQVKLFSSRTGVVALKEMSHNSG